MSQPKLVKSDGVLLAVYDDGRVVQFCDDASAEFFVHACASIPSLLDALDLANARTEALGGGQVEALEGRIAALERELEASKTRARHYEKRCFEETAARMKAAQMVQRGMHAARTALALHEQVQALQSTLDDERRKNGASR